MKLRIVLSCIAAVALSISACSQEQLGKRTGLDDIADDVQDHVNAVEVVPGPDASLPQDNGIGTSPSAPAGGACAPVIREGGVIIERATPNGGIIVQQR